MSRMKRSGVHREKKRASRRTTFDNHHLCFFKNRWNHGSVYKIRQHHYCIMPIPRETLHRYIHENMACIPVPSEIAAKAALEQLEYLEEFGAISDDDPIEKRLNLLAALFDSIAQPTADGFRNQLRLVREYYE